jgi:hypothetical protein
MACSHRGRHSRDASRFMRGPVLDVRQLDKSAGEPPLPFPSRRSAGTGICPTLSRRK